MKAQQPKTAAFRGIEGFIRTRFSFSWTQYNPQHPNFLDQNTLFFDKHQKISLCKILRRHSTAFFWVNT